MPRFRCACSLLIVMVLPTFVAQAQPPSFDDWFKGQRDGLVTLYRDLHQAPELSFQEVKTAQKIAAELKAVGAEVTTGLGRTGVVGVLKNGPGPRILIRTDLDALPVREATGLPYASKAESKDHEGKSVGVMHACGHDMHMTCLVGTARWLAAHKDRWSGTAILVGQPAEELVSGARAMLEDGLYRLVNLPDYALAIHVTNDQPTGFVTYTTGAAFAGSTAVDITIRGRGGHGAAPHLAIDPIVLSALAIVDLQTIVSREVDPLQPSVVTVGSIHGGSKHNIIPESVKLQLTLRAYNEPVRQKLLDGIQRRIKGLAQAHGAPEPAFEVAETTPPTINTPALVEKVVPFLREALGKEHVLEVPPVMGAEDFGLFSNGGVPTFMFRLGTIDPKRFEEHRTSGQAIPSLHSAQYYPDAPGSLRSGVRAMTAAVVGLAPPKK